MHTNERLSHRQVWIILATVALLGALVYGRVVSFPFVRWDDALLITEQPAVRAIAPWSIAWIFTHFDPELYIPLTFLTYQIDWQIGGGAAWPFHLGNLILHTLNAFLLALLSIRFLNHRWIGVGVGLLFLLHPLHTEAVGWASARKDVLSTCLFLGSFLLYLRWREDREQRWYVWSIAAFGVGLLAKVSIVMLPLMLLFADWRNGRPLLSKEQIKEKWPYFGLAAAFTLIALLGKSRLVAATGIGQKLLIACVSTMFYLKQIVWPFHFSLLYPFTEGVNLTTPMVLWSVIGVGIAGVIMLALLIIAVRRSGIARDIVAWGAWYVITLAPTFLNFSKGGDMDVYFASDRYAYVPSIGVFLAIGSTLIVIIQHRKSVERAVLGVGCAALVFLGWRSYLQLNVWQSTETLFRHVIEEFPESSHVAHNNLGNAYRIGQELDRAIAEYHAALAVREHPKILSNLGAALRQQGKIDESIATYQRALTIMPDSSDAHFGLGIVLAQRGRLADAEAHYAEAMRLSPTTEQIPTNLGALYAQQGRWQDAVDAYMIALRENPYYPDARYNLAIALEELGRLEDARDAYENVIQLVPSSVSSRINLGLLLAKLGDRAGSAAQFRAILRINPSNATAKEALRQLGQ